MAASMASGIGRCCWFLSKNSCGVKLLCDVQGPVLTVPVRNSSYGPIYMEPTISKKELDEPMEKTDERRFRPIKAATNDQISSSTYDPLISKFIRQFMRKGNKQIARLCMDRTIERIKQFQLEKYHKEKSEEKRALIELEPMSIIYKAVENCKPVVKIQTVKRAGVIYMVPIPTRPSYQLYQSIDWIIEASTTKHRSNPDIRVWDDMAREFIDAARNEGSAIRKKQELHRVCEANRAYAHYRW